MPGNTLMQYMMSPFSTRECRMSVGGVVEPHPLIYLVSPAHLPSLSSPSSLFPPSLLSSSPLPLYNSDIINIDIFCGVTSKIHIHVKRTAIEDIPKVRPGFHTEVGPAP